MFKGCKSPQSPLLLGAVKANIGHTEAASGMAGLIKAILVGCHKKTTPNSFFSEPNPACDWSEYPLDFNPESINFSSESDVYAGVSSFGISGTNSHVIIKNNDDFTGLNLRKPAYRFNAKSCWLDDKNLVAKQVPSTSNFCFDDLPDSMNYHVDYSVIKYPYVLDHKVSNITLMPATGYIDLILMYTQRIYGAQSLRLSQLTYFKPLTFHDQEMQHLIIKFNKLSAKLLVQIYHNDIELVSAQIEEYDTPAVNTIDIQAYQNSFESALEKSEIYYRLEQQGYQFGPMHQCVASITVCGNEAFAFLNTSLISCNDKTHFFHPALLDACCHPLLLLLPECSPSELFITMGKDTFTLLQKPEETLFVRCVLTDLYQKDPKTVKANIYIYNLAGQCVAFIEGYTMRKTQRDFLSLPKPSKDDAIYALQWVEKKRRLDSTQTLAQEDLLCVQQQDIDRTLKQLLVEQFHSVSTCILPLAITDDVHVQKQLEQFSLSGNPSRIVYFYTNEPQIGHLEPNAGLLSLMRLVRELSKTTTQEPVIMYVVTSGAMQLSANFIPDSQLFATLWGLCATVNLEYRKIRCVHIDFDEFGSIDSYKNLLDELKSNPSTQDLVKYTCNKRYIRQCLPYIPPLPQEQVGSSKQVLIEQFGSLDNLHIVNRTVAKPQADELTIQVFAVGLNFFDVVYSMEMLDVPELQNQNDKLGLECAGLVIAKGSNVSAFQPGDRVFGFVPGSLGEQVTVNARRVVMCPKNVSMAQAATIPIAYLTAYYGLCHLIRIKPGMRVLIHAATGGVGMAAVQIVRHLGGEIFATASRSKWPMLKNFGIHHIMDSRALDFADQILIATENRGVDVVMNSLTGAAIHENIRCLKEGGCFLEVGKTAIMSPEIKASYAKSFHYHAYDLHYIVEKTPELMHSLLVEIQQNILPDGMIKPLPYRSYPLSHSVEALKTMQRGLHRGKVVIECAHEYQIDVNDEKRAVVIVGGLGGIGFSLIQPLLEKGYKNIVLLSRSKPKTELINQLELIAIQDPDATIKTMQVDAADKMALQLALSTLEASEGIVGIIHAAGVVQDHLIEEQDAEKLHQVIRSKVTVAKNLHEITSNYPLRFFILFSSVTSILGAAGSSAYAAGNAYLDALAAYRMSVSLPFLCLNWGPWAEVGMLTKLPDSAKQYWIGSGMKPFTNEQAINIFKRLFTTTGCFLLAECDWQLWIKQYPPQAVPSILHQFVTASTDDTGRFNNFGPSTTQAENVSAMNKDYRQLVLDILLQITGDEVPTDIDNEMTFNDLGIDSLLAVEFRNALSQKMGKLLAPTLLFNYPTMQQLTDYLETLNDES